MYHRPQTLSSSPHHGERFPTPAIQARRPIRQGEHLEIEDPADIPYEHIEVLGHGGTAVVEKVRDMRSGLFYARKSLKINTGNLSKVKGIYQHEVDVIKRLGSHHHIIRVFATYRTERTFAIILDPVASEGDLGGFLTRYRDLERGQERTAMFSILKRAFGCLSNGLAFMHENTIRHKDIKPQNILIHHGSFIFTDFGIARDYHNDISTTEGHPGAHTRRYCAPEVADWGQRNSKSDVFSLGCVFLEILASRFREFFAPQFVDEPFNLRLDYVTSKLELIELFLEIRPRYSLLMSITKDMLTPEPAVRDTSARVYQRVLGCGLGICCSECFLAPPKLQENIQICLICLTAMPGKHELNVHLRYCHADREAVYYCHYQQEQGPCGNRYATRESAYHHISQEHFMVPLLGISSWSIQANATFPHEPNLYIVHRDLIAICHEIKAYQSELEEDLDFPHG